MVFASNYAGCAETVDLSPPLLDGRGVVLYERTSLSKEVFGLPISVQVEPHPMGSYVLLVSVEDAPANHSVPLDFRPLGFVLCAGEERWWVPWASLGNHISRTKPSAINVIPRRILSVRPDGYTLARSTDRELTTLSISPYMGVPLPIAEEVAEVITEACQWFSNPSHVFLGSFEAPPFPDQVVQSVIYAMQAQLDKEGQSRCRNASCGKHGERHHSWYALRELPPSRQRALVERIWQIKQRSAASLNLTLYHDRADTVHVATIVRYDPDQHPAYDPSLFTQEVKA